MSPSAGSPELGHFLGGFVVLNWEVRLSGASSVDRMAGAWPSEQLMFASTRLPWEFTFIIPVFMSVYWVGGNRIKWVL